MYEGCVQRNIQNKYYTCSIYPPMFDKNYNMSCIGACAQISSDI